MVPEGWEDLRLKDIAPLQRGYDLTKDNLAGGNVPVISSSGFWGYHNQSKANAPGIVIGRYGTLGEVFYIEDDYWPHNTTLWVTNFNGNHPKYIHYLYCSLDISKYSGKTGVPGLNRNDLHAIKIPLPPLSEQKAIAGILSTWDRAIELTEQLIAAKQQRKQALIHAIFSQKVRLKDPNGNSYPDWKLQRLGELYNISSSKRVFQSEWKSSGIPFYRAREIIKLSKEGCVDNQLYISKKMYHEYANKYGAPKIGDILITGVGTIGVLYHVQNNSPFYFKDGNIIWLRSRSSIISRYLKHVFDSRMVKKQILESASITTVATYTIDSAKKTKIPVPHHDEQKRIAEILDQQDSEIEKLKQKRSLQQAQKKGLMQQLLTGKVRVKGGAD